VEKRKNGKLYVKSMYNQLGGDNGGYSFNRIWKAKLPYKIKIFVWLVENNVVLTKDNMIKRRWVGSPVCQFCNEQETINHLFFECVVLESFGGL
jgi:hypothetical protein